MKYNVELISCGSEKLKVVKELKELFGTDLATAKQISESVPVMLLENTDADTAERVEYILESCGAKVQLTALDTGFDPSLPISGNVYTTTGTDRERLVQLYNAYKDRDAKLKAVTAKIEEQRRRIPALEGCIQSVRNDIDKNRRLVMSQGESNRPKAKLSFRFYSVPDFDILKTIFLSVTIVVFVLFMILVAVAPDWLESFIPDNMAGLMVWLGSPIAGLAVCLVVVVVNVIRDIIDSVSSYKSNLKERNSYSANNAVNAAEEFLSRIEKHKAEIADYENKISSIKADLIRLDKERREIRVFAHDIPIPGELKSVNGVALLIDYIDKGRAYTIQEAVNLYYNDVAQQKMLNEAQKQTAYVQQQAENARIAAENSEEALKLARETAANAERAADAAQTAANYERWSYWDSVARDSRNK